MAAMLMGCGVGVGVNVMVGVMEAVGAAVGALVAVRVGGSGVTPGRSVAEREDGACATGAPVGASQPVTAEQPVVASMTTIRNRSRKMINKKASKL
jgi:hypothetical protein